MKRILAVVALCLTYSALALADAPHASLVLARQHHVKHHHAHKAGKHHAPKHHHNSI